VPVGLTLGRRAPSPPNGAAGSDRGRMDSMQQQLEHERLEADLRKDYHEAISNVEKLHKKTSVDILDGVRSRLKNAKWMRTLGDASESVLEEIHMHIVEEQEEVRALHERSVVKLRTAIDAFHEGMAQKHKEVSEQAKVAEKDKLLDSRAAAGEEVEIAKRKQGYELNEKMRIMEEKYLAEIAELKRRMAEAIEQRDAEIEGLKLSLSKQGKELAELRKEHDLLKSANEKDREELLMLRKLCKDQESEITDLRMEIEKMAAMRDGFDELMQKIEDRVQKILNEARRGIRKMHDAVAQPQNVMDALDTMKEGPVMEALHHAINSVLRDRDSVLEKVQALNDRLARIEMEHAQALHALRKELEKAQGEIDMLKSSSGSKMAALQDKIAELEARVNQLGEDKRALTVALTSGVERVDDEHKSIQGTLQEQEKYLNKYRTRIAQLEAGQNERKRLELQMVAENRKTSELRHLSRLCTRLLKDKDEKSSELADAISRAQLAATSFTISGGDHSSGGGDNATNPQASSGGIFGFSPDPSMLKPSTASSVGSLASVGMLPGPGGRQESALLDGGYDVRAAGGAPPSRGGASRRGLASRGGGGGGGTRPIDDELLRDLSSMGSLPKDVTNAWVESKHGQPRRHNPRMLPGM
jgi:chromosome segregation ATPase